MGYQYTEESPRLKTGECQSIAIVDLDDFSSLRSRQDKAVRVKNFACKIEFSNVNLFLDELTEFKRDVLEFLRQPLEDGFVTISRTKQSVTFPAQFTLVASTNPCPCGYYGDTIQGCTCSPRQREQYWAKLSGPLMDRIDLQVAVNRLKPEEITQQPTGEPSKSVAQRVEKAREKAVIRFEKEENLQCNAQMQSRHLQKWCKLDDASRNLLEAAIRKLGLSARASDRILKVSRTIADLAADENLNPQHVAEAIQYRTIDRMQ